MQDLFGLVIASANAPTISDAAIAKNLHESLVAIGVIIAFGVLIAILEKVDALSSPLREAGISIPFWPAMVCLLLLAAALAYPEIHDYSEIGKVAGADMRAESLQADALNKLSSQPTTECGDDEIQRELNESTAVAMDAIDRREEAAAIRSSSTPRPECSNGQ